MPETSAPASTAIVSTADVRDDLISAPITASDVISGAPVARALMLEDVGHGLSTFLWDCTAGRFHWDFGPCDETVHIVAGAVTVTDEQGGIARLVVGDVVTFRAGTRAIWDVEEYVKKVAVLRTLPGDPLSRSVRALRSLAQRLKRRLAG